MSMIKRKYATLGMVLITFLWISGCVPQAVRMEAPLPAKTDVVAAVSAHVAAPSEPGPVDIGEIKPYPMLEPAPLSQEGQGATESAREFMEWYIAYLEGNKSPSGELFYPFEDRMHKQVDLFTEEYSERIEQILAVPVLERGIFDPLMHNWGFIKDYNLEVVSIDEQAALIAVQFTGLDLPSWAGVTLDLVKKETGWKIEDIRSENVANPAGVTKLFYDWYFGYYRNGGNPFRDGVYKTSEYLSQPYILRVAEAPERPDPFTLSMEIPFGCGILDEPLIIGDKARVNLVRFFYSSQSQPLVVHLEKSQGSWLIVEATLEEAPLNITEVVEAFYEWYLEYTKPDDDGNFKNALVDGAYHDSPYLAETFKVQLDQRKPDYDPLLCAQDIPTLVITDGFYLERLYPPTQVLKGSVVVRSNFPGHIFTVDLARPGGSSDEWNIEAITCTFNPEGTVKTFYTWYQGCLEGSTTCHSPHAGQAYPSTGLITKRFEEQVEALRAEFAQSGGGGYDPIVLAQDDFPAFEVVKVYESISGESSARRARVFLRNLGQGDQSSGHQGLLVTLVMDGPYLKIDNVTAYFENSPQKIASKFYTWYKNLLHSERNPELVYGFEPEAYLSAEYIHKVRPALESRRMEGYNPILLCDQLPVKMEVGNVKVAGERANLVIERYFEGQDSPSPLTVEMEKIDDWWVIVSAEVK
jgi:hypothetical protein